MANENELLMKMHGKALAAHFKKAAAHHEKKAALHEKMAETHHAHAEHHTEHIAKAKEVGHDHLVDHHKSSAAFHKTKATHHEKLHKLHSAHAEHHHKVAEAIDSDDAKKVAQLLEIEIPGDTMVKTDPTPAPTPAASAPAATTPTPAVTTTPIVAQGDFNETIGKALDTKLTEAVGSAFERVLNSEDFNKKVDQAIAEKLLNKLNVSVVPNEIKTFPVPRPGEVVVKTNGGQTVGIDPELAWLASTEQ